jgi:hypothetical protein
VTLDIGTEMQRMRVDKRIAELLRVAPRYQTAEERSEMEKLRAWQRRNPIRMERRR